jgi:hypothetical protein
VPVAAMPTRPTSRLACVFVAGIVVLATLALIAPSAAMASACGDRVLEDWWDNNRIDRVYPVQCYRDAIDSIPDDLRDYANVEEVITRALNQVLNGDGPSGPSGPGGPEETPVDRTADPNPGGEDPAEVLDNVDSSSPSSIPIPLLLLAAMSLLLLGAGGLGYLSRRRNAEAVDETPPADDLG